MKSVKILGANKLIEIEEYYSSYLKEIQYCLEGVKKKINYDEKTVLDANVIFAQHEAGSGVCIDPSGIILTCAHCVEEREGVSGLGATHLVLFVCGVYCYTKCIAWDPTRDLALIQVTKILSNKSDRTFRNVDSNNSASNNNDGSSSNSHSRTNSGSNFDNFPFISIASPGSFKVNLPIICIGQPGANDLETDEIGKKTDYPLVSVSVGKFKGFVQQDDGSYNLQDNSEIGQLKQNAWTYWGHSGGALISSATGELIGLHSSWDDNTGMRHGVANECILEFLQLNPIH